MEEQQALPDDLKALGIKPIELPDDLKALGVKPIESAPAVSSGPQMNFAIVNKKEVPVDTSKETGIPWLNNIIRPYVNQLAGKESGIMNPDPDQNPLMNKSFLPETQASPGVFGAVRHFAYENLVRPMASPLGILGTALDANPPTEPIGLPKAGSIVGREAVPEVSVKPPEVVPEVKPISPDGTVNWQAVADHLDKDPAIASGEVVKPSIDKVAEAAPPQSAEDAVVPRPGQPKGIAAWESNLRSPHKVLLEHPETASIAESILNAYDTKQIWLRQVMEEAGQYVKGLDKDSRVIVGKLLQGIKSPASPQLTQIAADLKNVIDAVHARFPARTLKTGPKTGFLDQYFELMEKQPEGFRDGLQSIAAHYLGEDTGVRAVTRVEELPRKGVGAGPPKNPYPAEFDVNKILPAYFESAARIIFDKKVIERAQSTVRNMPHSMLKEMADWYVKNYAGYNAAPGLHQAWSNMANRLGSITAHSVIDFNPGLHMLHLGELPANVWPELGTKYASYGLAKFIKSPLKTWTEMARLGLLSNEIKPLVFKTLGDKYSSASYFLSYAESIVKGVSFYGAEKRLLDAGMNPTLARLQAVRAAKDMTMTVDPVRQMKVFTSGSNVMGGEVASRLGSQFKGIPAKIVEQYAEFANNLKNNPKQAKAWLTAAQSIAGGFATVKATEAGMHMYHVSPSSLLTMTALGPFGVAMGQISHDLYKGDWQKALVDTATWAAPAGRNIRKGLSLMFED